MNLKVHAAPSNEMCLPRRKTRQRGIKSYSDVCLYVMVRHVDGLRGLLLRKLGCRFLLTFCAVICYVCVHVQPSVWVLAGGQKDGEGWRRCDNAAVAENWEGVKTRRNERMSGGCGKQMRRNNVLLERVTGLFVESWSVLPPSGSYRTQSRPSPPTSLSLSRRETIAAFFTPTSLKLKAKKRSERAWRFPPQLSPFWPQPSYQRKQRPKVHPGFIFLHVFYYQQRI